MPRSHSGLEVLEVILGALHTYGITSQLGYITSDNYGANDTLNAHLSTKLLDTSGITWDPKLYRARCLGHIVNLPV